jgi:hypothetical protein
VSDELLSLGEVVEVCQYVHDDGEKLVDVMRYDAAVEDYEQYTAEWAVTLTKGSDIADEIAERLGFMNDGQVATSQVGNEQQTVYRFFLKQEGALYIPTYQPYDGVTQNLTAEESVAFAEQKKVEVQCSRKGSVDREKRQNQAVNQTIIWLSPSHLILSWGHPENGRPGVYHIVYSAIVITGGRVTATYKSLVLAGNETSEEYTSVSRNDIHIFLVNSVYASSVHSAVYVEGHVSIPVPANMTVETLNCSTIKVSWEPPPIYGFYTYAVVLFNGSIFYWNVGSVTMIVITDLGHLQTFLIFVVAMSGNQYSALYKIHTIQSVRLVNGGHPCEGRVEVHHDGQWGTVCDALWNLTDANVICSQVRCGEAIHALSPAYFGYGTGPIWMHNVSCSGEEKCLEECPHRGWGTHSCDHSEDVGVHCAEPVPPTFNTTSPPSGEEKCPSLGLITNGRLSVTGSTPGSNATYICYEGYVLVGNATRICLDSGVWSGTDPQCDPEPTVTPNPTSVTPNTAVICPSLSMGSNGRWSATEFTPGSTATYTCYEGYELVGNATRTCLDSGKWSGTEPQCDQVICPPLDTIQNGEMSANGYTPGSTATYTCDVGFTHVGDATRTCLISGVWSMIEPRCEPGKKDIQLLCTNQQ